MPEFVSMSSGELVDYNPATSLELELIIRELGDRLEKAVPTLKKMWHDRYEAERELRKAKARAILSSRADSVTEKRAEADIATIEHQFKFDTAKEVLHAAEALQDALKAKLIGYQNINKVNAAAYGVGGVGR